MDNQIPNINQTNKSSEYQNQISVAASGIPKIVSKEEVKNKSIQQAEKDKSEDDIQKKELKKSLKKKKEKQKVDYINILLILAICLLFAVIVFPPLLRKLMPNRVIVKNEANKNAIILSCTGITLDGQYKITSRTKYLSGIAKQNIIIYTKLTEEELMKESSTIPKIAVNINDEINFLGKVSGVYIEKNSDNVIIYIYDYIAEINTSNFRFMKYFQKLDAQKSFYSSQGYKCQEIKN